MWKMLQQNKPEDFVIATEKTYSVKTFINLVTSKLGLKTKWIGKGLKEKLINKENNQIIIKINPKYFRPSEVNYLKGDCKKAKKILNWKNNTSLEDLVNIMVDYEISNLTKS